MQSAAFLLIGRIALLPAATFLLFRAVETYATVIGLKHNPRMDGVLMEKFSAQFPDTKGNYGNKASNSDVAVLLIGTQSNQFVIPVTLHCISALTLLTALWVYSRQASRIWEITSQA